MLRGSIIWVSKITIQSCINIFDHHFCWNPQYPFLANIHIHTMCHIIKNEYLGKVHCESGKSQWSRLPWRTNSCSWDSDKYERKGFRASHRWWRLRNYTHSNIQLILLLPHFLHLLSERHWNTDPSIQNRHMPSVHVASTLQPTAKDLHGMIPEKNSRERKNTA